MENIWKYLGKETPSEKIGIFRISFGLVLFFQSWHFFSIDFIQLDVLDPVLHFSYPYLSFIQPLDPYSMYGFLIVMFISSIMMIIGVKSRLFTALYFFVFTYLFLIDKGYYNNHYYLISLLLLIMMVVKSDTRFSLLPTKQRMNFKWEEFLLIFLFSLVLIFAGLNKLNPWWLVHHEPVHHILEAKAIWTATSFWRSPFIEYIMVWGGMFFDLFIVPLLLWNRTRTYAVIAFLFFNGMNYIVFSSIGEIGIFPLLMLSSLILFFPSTSIQHALAKYSKSTPIEATKVEMKFSFVFKVLFILFISVQLVLPLRHHFFPGNADYTGEGQRFSWRMKSMYKDFSITFILKDEERNISASLDPRTVLTEKQYTNLAYYPELIIPVMQNLRIAAINKGVKEPMIYVVYKVGFMGLPLQYIVDPKMELTKVKYSPFQHSSWILPLKQDY